MSSTEHIEEKLRSSQELGDLTHLVSIQSFPFHVFDVCFMYYQTTKIDRGVGAVMG